MIIQTVTIDSIANVKGGKRLPKGHEFLTSPNNHPYIRARDIGDGKIEIKEPVYIADSTFQKISRYTVKNNDLAITIVGVNIGDIGIITEELDGANLTENASRISTNSKLCDPKFLLGQLSTSYNKFKFQQIAAGAAQGKLGLFKIKSFKVILPEITVQKKIADIHFTYTYIVENNHQRIQLLEESARLLFREWFVYFKFPNHEKIKIVDGVPEGWKKEKLNKLVSLFGGYSFKSSSYQQEGKYGIVTIKNVQQGSFVPECTDYLDDAPNVMKKHCFLSSGDILLSLTGNVGRVCLVYGENYLLNQRVAKIEPKNSIPKSFIYWMFEDSMMQKRIENLSYGSAQQNLSPVKLGEQKVILPPIQLLNSFDEIVSLINLEIIQLLKQNQKLAQARDLLLPRLMSGEIEV